MKHLIALTLISLFTLQSLASAPAHEAIIETQTHSTALLELVAEFADSSNPRELQTADTSYSGGPCESQTSCKRGPPVYCTGGYSCNSVYEVSVTCSGSRGTVSYHCQGR